MLNNWLFRVAIIKHENENGIQLRFEHPAPVGPQQFPGWMEVCLPTRPLPELTIVPRQRLKAEGQDITRPVFSIKKQAEVAQVIKKDDKPLEVMTKAGVTRKITSEELASQDKERPWFVVNGEVYDGVPFLLEHPGGPDSILLAAGEDASEDFIAIHSAEGRSKLAEVPLVSCISGCSMATLTATSII